MLVAWFVPEAAPVTIYAIAAGTETVLFSIAILSPVLQRHIVHAWLRGLLAGGGTLFHVRHTAEQLRWLVQSFPSREKGSWLSEQSHCITKAQHSIRS
jgi:hypothetical protein